MPRIEIEDADIYECAGDDTILRAALRNGLGFPYSCNVGSCGTCRFQLIEGEVEHLRPDPPAWSDRDRSRGRWLGCQARPLHDCVIRVRTGDEVPPHLPVRRGGRLIEAAAITHDVREFRFAIDGPDHFLPGQYALLDLEGVQGARPYSMSNLPGSGEWHFLIKQVPGGAATEMLFSHLGPGDPVRMDGPFGLAYLREDRPRDLLLVAGGSGLSPMVSIARAVATSHRPRRIHFFYGGRRPGDLCAESLLSNLPGFGERITLVSAVSEASEGWDGHQGFIHEVVRIEMGHLLAEVEVYFAGPPPMTQAMQQMLHQAGVGPERIHYDEFF